MSLECHADQNPTQMSKSEKYMMKTQKSKFVGKNYLYTISCIFALQITIYGKLGLDTEAQTSMHAYAGPSRARQGHIGPGRATLANRE